METPEQKMAQRNVILRFLTGSHAYGTETPNSDKDYMGVFIPNEEYVLGNKTCEQVQIRTNNSGSGKQNTKDDVDIVIYSLPKFIKLLTANNPTILETLYYPKKNILVNTELGQELLDSASLFVSKKVKHTFLGYAFTQKKGLTHKRERWMVIGEAARKLDEMEASGITKLPERLNLESELREDKTWGIYEKGQPITTVKSQLDVMLASYGYRVEDIKKHGFSTKFASHLVRLLEEGVEILVEGKLTFPLSYNNLLRDIKMGKMSLDKILEIADAKEKLVEEAYIRSPLQHSPDIEKIDELQIRMLKKFWKYKCVA